ncbi:MAG: rod shape-determining protein MreD [Alphaproteobacteria bacterium]|nr:MAG: rod shape-determining protein MreD [Alphaproteobacteria bacterium]
MIDPVTLHRIWFALLFALLSALVIFVRLLPFGTLPGALPPPDLIVLLGFAWVIRRPDFVPVLLFAAVLLVADLLFLRPPGLYSGMAVLGLETLRRRAKALSEQSFLAEWVTVGVVLLAMMLGARALSALFFVPRAPFGLEALAVVSNVLAWPAVVAFSVWVLRVRRLAPGEHAAEARLT